jgi:biotin operon repressor
MTKDKVLRVLQDYQYFYEPVKQRHIAVYCGISTRHVRECVQSLRKDGWAIGEGKQGYFLAFDKEQLQHTINAFRMRNRTTVDTIFNLENADKFGRR